MINFTGDFIDGYGVTHTDPVFAINYANMTSSSQQGVNLDLGTGQYASSEHSSVRISYGVLYWTSQTAKDNGARPIEFVTPEGHAQINITLNSEPTEDLITVCEADFSTSYLS